MHSSSQSSCHLGVTPYAWIAAVVTVLLMACGGPGTPARGVIEADVEGWGFRRYQQVLDIEVWIKKNKAVAHTASYARKSSEKKGHIDGKDVVNAFITRYKKNKGVTRALIVFARRLAQQSGYKVTERKLEGTRLFEVAGPVEYWLLWPAKEHIIKLGGRGLSKVSGDLIEAYSDRYPSRLKSGSLEGPLPGEEEQPEVTTEEYDPENPRPEWQ